MIDTFTHSNQQAPSVIAHLWQSVPHLAHLPPSVINALSTASQCRACSAGELIFCEGDPVAGVFIIEQGTIKICRFSKDGREHILHILQRGDTFNDMAALDGGPNPASAIAFSDAVIWRVDRSSLRVLAREHPDFAWALLESVARRARFLVNVVQDLAMRNVRGRLARLLLEQAEANTDDQFVKLLTQEEMANHLGTVREVLGRALRSFAAEGLIEMDRHRIVILDRERLAEEADI
jgi:CRP/FNR family cyclic AMP-dependent transcriptional regulator